MNRRAFAARALALPAAFRLGAAGLVLAGPAAADVPHVFAPGGNALGGVDPVSYGRRGAPKPGSPSHALMWRGAVWHFESAETLALFEADPKAYAPRYGGYCALAMAGGRTEPSSPAVWARHEGRIYLLRSAERRERWLGDVVAQVARADLHWTARR